MIKRVFLIVLDSFGIGETPDAKDYKDQGSNTLKSVMSSKNFSAYNLTKLGLLNIDGIDFAPDFPSPCASYARCLQKSKGKDTVTGHWEIAGIISDTAMPVYPYGFPKELIDEFEAKTGRKVLCNKPYSGTQVIKDYGKEHIESGSLIVYTSADSVFQIAAHEDIVGISELYRYCDIAREICRDDNGVGRVIARPFAGDYPNFVRTGNRHDFSLPVPKKSILDVLSISGFDTIAIGKIKDIFAGSGIKTHIAAKNNGSGMAAMDYVLGTDFNGLCFTNLVDFDMLYGHRNDVDGYASAISEFDDWLETFIPRLQNDDLLIITADHGCDPATSGTDHTREYIPLIIYKNNIECKNLGTRESFSDIGKSIADIFSLENELCGESFIPEIGGL